MSDDLEKTLYTTHRNIQDKHVYFLLAAAGAAIGFALTQTTSATLHWPQLPLGFAVVCWGMSFYCGCNHVNYAAATVYTNKELLRVKSGRHPDTYGDPQIIQIAADATREAIEKHSNAAGRAFRWQFRLLVLGAALFVVWHVGEMYLRSPMGIAWCAQRC